MHSSFLFQGLFLILNISEITISRKPVIWLTQFCLAGSLCCKLFLQMAPLSISIPDSDICQIWYTATLIRPVKRSTKKCVNL